MDDQGEEKWAGMLSPYRVLDLSDETGYLCGKMFGDLGADVIKIERPCGDAGRSHGPFYHDQSDAEKSLFWFAYNNNKRGITLDIETADGREIFKRLATTADIVIESFGPGYMDQLGLGYSVLAQINPRLIFVSITPFGQSGPYKDYKAPDIVAWAMGGQMYAWGDADRPPVHVSYHSQAHLHTAADAAVGALIALYSREVTGEGQRVDASVLESSVQATWRVTDLWDMQKKIRRRGDPMRDVKVSLRQIWRCKDGYVVFRYVTGPNAKKWQQPLVDWLDSEGFADDFLKQLDFDTLDMNTATQDVVDRMQAPLAEFFMAHTKAELFQGAIDRNIQLHYLATTRDIQENPQLTARGFWKEVHHSELSSSIMYPGGYALSSGLSPTIVRPAPLIGEHNQDIYEHELGFSKEQLIVLKEAGVI